MIGHMLKMYVLTDKNKDWKDKEIEVMVTADQWEYAQGRNIEFIAVGLPEFFAFAVAEQRNTTTDTLIRSGDCRQGSWAGIATKIGMNQYQGIQSTGVANSASGLLGVGTASHLELTATKAGGNDTARAGLGTRMDSSLVNSYAKGADVAGLFKDGGINLPFYSNKVLDTPPGYMYPANFGSALEPTTRTIRGTPAQVRKEVYDRTGGIATTCFDSYGENKVGGLTWLSRGIQVVGTTPIEAMRMLAEPYTANQMGEVTRGSQGNATWYRWMIAGGTTTTPYQVHYLLLTIAPDGTQTWNSSTGITPSSESGSGYAPEAYTMFTDEKAATADNETNRNVVLEAYYASKSKESSYKINYPVCVPVAYTRPIDRVGGKTTGINKWTTRADFINHEYIIGGE